jgi:hypothetical protein
VSAIAAALPRVRTLSPRLVLAAIVLVGAAVDDLLGRVVRTPGLFPDEYLYSQLGRSLATTGHLAVRGVDPHFLPVLAPVLNAPLWLVPDVGTAHRLIQAENALFFALAAIPAYRLARSLGVATRVALVAAAATVVGAPALYTPHLLAEPLAYPLCLAVVAAGVELIARPSRRSQLLFLVLATLATLTRIQLALLPLCVAVAVAVIGLRERRLRAAVREQLLLLGLIGGALAAGLAVLFVRGFGYYDVGLRVQSAGTAGRMAGVDLYVVLIAAGAAIAPSALVGIAQAIAQPRGRRELAFGVVATLAALGTIAQCVLWGDADLVQERYLIYLLPLLVIGFCLRRSRPRRRPLVEIGVAAAIAATAALVPLAGYAIDDANSLVPVLDGLTHLQARLHNESGAAAIFALGTTVLVGLGAATAAWRRATVATLLVSMAGAGAVLGLSTAWAAHESTLARHNFLPADVHWIDHASAGDKTLVIIGKASMGGTLTNLFWNPSVKHVVRTRDAARVDWIDDPIARVAGDGTLSVEGKPLTGTVVVSSDPSAVVVLADATKLQAVGPVTTWRTDAPARLGILLSNRRLNGEALRTGGVRVWQHGGWLELSIGAPEVSHVPATVTFTSAKLQWTVRVPAGGTALARLPVCGTKVWSASFTASPATAFHDQWLAPTLGIPRFVPDARACS